LKNEETSSCFFLAALAYFGGSKQRLLHKLWMRPKHVDAKQTCLRIYEAFTQKNAFGEAAAATVSASIVHFARVATTIAFYRVSREHCYIYKIAGVVLVTSERAANKERPGADKERRREST
jgi:hypothetical protein